VARPFKRQFWNLLAAGRLAGRRLAILAVLAAGSIAYASARAEDTLNVATWGGAYAQSQEIAFFEPFARETGMKIATETYDGTLAKIKEMIAGSVATIDVVDLSAVAAGTLCEDGLLEKIEISSLGAAPGGESAEEDFYAGALSPCGVASVAWSTAIAFDRQAFPKGPPAQIADLLDLKKFPGKRTLPNGARYTLELALLADGVDPANVYTELATQTGADRAFTALDKIKKDTYWWDNAQEPITWLLEKEVAMAAGYSGRIFRAAVGDRQRLGVIWDGQIYDLDLWAIPKNARNKAGAVRFIAFATDPARLAAQAQLIAYGPMRKSALAMVGKHPVIAVEMQDFLPTSPNNFKKALKFDEGWWNAHGADLQKRFEEWRGPLAPGQGKPQEPTMQDAQPAPAPTQALP
jgi:putative spermidine/putrescine transport system substrate-binding protein